MPASAGESTGARAGLAASRRLTKAFPCANTVMTTTYDHWTQVQRTNRTPHRQHRRRTGEAFTTRHRARVVQAEVLDLATLLFEGLRSSHSSGNSLQDFVADLENFLSSASRKPQPMLIQLIDRGKLIFANLSTSGPPLTVMEPLLSIKRRLPRDTVGRYPVSLPDCCGFDYQVAIFSAALELGSLFDFEVSW